jgi:hypothetical protein
MLQGEAQIRDRFAGLLKNQGHEIKTEARLSMGFRIDIFAEKEGVRRAIEVKISQKNIFDDISKCQRLLRLPEIMEAYVAAPETLITEDHKVFAERLGVGIIAFSKSTLDWLVTSRRLKPPELMGSGGHPSTAMSGETFLLHRDVRNHGQKIAQKLEAYCIASGPFVIPRGHKRRFTHAYLEPEKEWRVEFTVRVKKGTTPGKYPLLTTITAENAERSDMCFEIEVESPKFGGLGAEPKKSLQGFDFDFFISVADEDRDIAQILHALLQKSGAVVFYYKYFKSLLFAERLPAKFASVCCRARFFIAVVSKYYVEKWWPRYEFSIAKEEETKRPWPFVLPLRLDDSPLPGLHPDIAYLDLRRETPESVVDILLEKLHECFPDRAIVWPELWVATFGLAIEELLENWELPPSAPSGYPVPLQYVYLCDWLEKDLDERLRAGPIKEFSYPEASERSGETLSVRIAFLWRPSEEPLDFGGLDWWEVLEVVPFEQVYPPESASQFLH